MTKANILIEKGGRTLEISAAAWEYFPADKWGWRIIRRETEQPKPPVLIEKPNIADVAQSATSARIVGEQKPKAKANKPRKSAKQ